MRVFAFRGDRLPLAVPTAPVLTVGGVSVPVAPDPLALADPDWLYPPDVDPDGLADLAKSALAGGHSLLTAAMTVAE